MDDQINMKLFEEFKPVSNEEWEELILKDLKGQDFHKKLVWKTQEGIEVYPYYRSDIYEKIDFHEQEAIIQYQRNTNDWLIFHEINTADPIQANEEARHFIQAGVNAIGFNARHINNVEKAAQLLNGINLKENFLSFSAASCNRFLRGLLNEYLVMNNQDSSGFRGCFDHDPLTFLITNGYLSDSYDALAKRLSELFDTVDAILPEFKALNIKGNIFHNSGADAVQELAVVFSILVEYIDLLTEKGLSPDNLLNHFQLTLGTGSSYFMEIAKLRAARLLWYQIANQYAVKKDSSKKAFIHAISSEWNMGVYDAHTNILRATTEAMSAIIGGANLLTLLPFDTTFRQSGEFSKRIAKNIQILLRDESHFNKVVDPAAGSYYIGFLTDALYKKSWELFLEIEEKGGYLKCVESGYIQNLIENTVEERKKNVNSGKEKILGVNLFPEINEKMLPQIDPVLFRKDEAVDIGVKVIQPYRKAYEFEDLRLKTEMFVVKGGNQPVIFMLPFGNPGMATARQIFSRNFFGVAGYKVIENIRFSDFGQAISHAVENKADVVVLCSADDEYLPAAKEIIPELKQRLPEVRIVVAGNPVASEELLQAGVDDFIHLKTNLFEKLLEYHKLFKIIS